MFETFPPHTERHRANPCASLFYTPISIITRCGSQTMGAALYNYIKSYSTSKFKAKIFACNGKVGYALRYFDGDRPVIFLKYLEK